MAIRYLSSSSSCSLKNAEGLKEKDDGEDEKEEGEKEGEKEEEGEEDREEKGEEEGEGEVSRRVTMRMWRKGPPNHSQGGRGEGVLSSGVVVVVEMLVMELERLLQERRLRSLWMAWRGS